MNRRFVEGMKKGLIVVGFLAFIYIIGAAGALELNHITVGDCLLRGTLGLAVLFVSITGYSVLDKLIAQEKQNKRMRLEARMRRAEMAAQLDKEMRDSLDYNAWR